MDKSNVTMLMGLKVKSIGLRVSI